jgi:AbrB family looped-hinge helix DNA binding protein
VVSTKGQTVIPKSVRKELGIKEGTKLAWIVRDGKLTVMPVPEDPVAASVGILAGRGYTFDDFMRERNEEREYERKLEAEEDEQWGHTSSTPRQ